MKNHPLKTALALALQAALLGATPALAQIRTDASLGQAAQSLTGPSYLIGQSLGKLSGANLFHSFQTFNLASGESATFTTSTAGIANVISRVTGGDASLINGKVTLQAVSGTPAFFFINPAGVVFGAGASIDVPGAFHASTADSLRFADGTRLQVDLSKTSSFSSAAPEAFGFLGTQRAAVVLRDRATLATNPLQAISLVGGDLQVDNAVIAGSGEIRLAAVGKQALDLPLAGPAPALSGQILLANEALIGSANPGSQDAGRISLDAGTITLDGLASISSYTRAGTSGRGAAISLRAAGDITISNGANLYATASGSGEAGTISLEANGIRLDWGGYIEGGTQAGSSGRGGAIQLLARQGLVLDTGASISSSVRGSGDGGLITVSAASARLSNSAYLAQLALSGSGNAGELRLQSSGDVSLDSGAQLLSYTQSSGTTGALRLSATGGLSLTSGSSLGNVAQGLGTRAGEVEVKLGGDLLMSGRSSIATTGLSGGNAGSIAVTARHMSLAGNSYITSGSIEDQGAAGDVLLNASGTVSLSDNAYISSNTYTDQNAGKLTLRAQSLLMSSGAQLGSSAYGGSGNAGAVDVAATQRVELSGGATIGSGSFARGNGGLVRVVAPLVSVAGPSLIYSTAAEGSLGDAGQIEIGASTRLSLSGGGSIDSSTLSLRGNAGNISITAGAVDLAASSISSKSNQAGSSGRSGTISLQTGGLLKLNQGSLISTSTSSAGNAGQIKLNAADVLLDQSSLLSLALPGSSGRGGNIVVTASGEIRGLRGNIGTSTYGSGTGGSVQLSARDILFDGPLSGVLASATAGSSGQAGSLDLRASGLLSLANGAALGTSNDAVVGQPGSLQPTLLSIVAGQIDFRDANVSAAASGNVAASRISIVSSESTRLLRSNIETSAFDGNGGPISLQAGRLLVLDNSVLTTSVLGNQGNGGSIALGADLVLMKTGFVQANTFAPLASGGLVGIEVKRLVASGNSLFVGGQTPLLFKRGVFGLNVIQAAAPTGVSGVIAITSPVLDLSGSLSVLEARPIDTGGLGRNPCQTREGSSLALAGRGGLPASARSWLGSDGLAAGAPLQPPASRSLAMIGVGGGGCR